MSFPANLTTMFGNQSQGNDTSCTVPPEDWTFTFVPVYIITISVLGIFLNVFVLMVFCLHKKACTVPEIYLSNLAAADLVLVTCLPFWAVSASRYFNWPFGRTLCKVVNVGIVMNAHCSIYFLVLVSIDRYLVLVYPMSQMRMRRSRYAKLGCLMVWGLGFLLSLPALIHRETDSFDGNTTLCYLAYPNTDIHLLSDIMFFTCSFFIPISIITFCTIKIIKVLRNRSIESSKSQNTDHKATTLILAVLFAFLICWVPFHLTKIPEILKQMKMMTECSLVRSLYICQQIFTYLAFFNSVLNPILYVIVGKNFQKKIRELIKQWSHHRMSTFSGTTTQSYLSRRIKAEDATT